MLFLRKWCKKSIRTSGLSSKFAYIEIIQHFENLCSMLRPAKMHRSVHVWQSLYTTFSLYPLLQTDSNLVTVNKLRKLPRELPCWKLTRPANSHASTISSKKRDCLPEETFCWVCTCIVHDSFTARMLLHIWCHIINLHKNPNESCKNTLDVDSHQQLFLNT